MDVKVNSVQGVNPLEATKRVEASSDKDFKFTLLSKIEEADLKNKK